MLDNLFVYLSNTKQHNFISLEYHLVLNSTIHFVVALQENKVAVAVPTISICLTNHGYMPAALSDYRITFYFIAESPLNLLEDVYNGNYFWLEWYDSSENSIEMAAMGTAVTKLVTPLG